MAELADDWPSLAPIRTACSTFSSNSNSSGSFPCSQYHHSFQSPPSSSSSSAFGLLHAAASSCTSSNTPAKAHSLLSKCLPPRPIINSGSPSSFRRQRKSTGSPAAAGAFGSYASFPGAKGTMICSSTAAAAAATATAAAATSTVSSHSAPLQYGNCRGHVVVVNAFTMIPAAVVGKKKPPDYLSDEPTSPEVTCMGKVRQSKNSACTWDALVNGSEKRECKKKALRRQQIEYHHAWTGDLDYDLQLAASIPRPLCTQSSDGSRIPKWRKIISIFKDIRDLHTPHILQRKLKQDDLIIDLEQIRRRTRPRIAGKAPTSCDKNEIEERKTEANLGSARILSVSQSCEGGEGEEMCGIDIEVLGEDGALDECGQDSCCTPSQTPNSCLLVMRNKSARSRVFHDDNIDDDDYNVKDVDDGDHGCKRAHSPLPCSPPVRASDLPRVAMHPVQSKNKKQAALSFLEKQKGFWKSKKLNSSFIKGIVTN